MIKGLDKFRAHFAQSADAFVLIGGVACHEWLASQGLPFRVTKDIDLVLIIEAVDQSFTELLWEFIEAGGYEVREKAGNRELYRFSKPKDDSYPAMIEIFSRRPATVELAERQRVVPVTIDEKSASLSAILLDDDYYSLIMSRRTQGDDLPRVDPAALIPLKARAWLDLTRRQKEGQQVDARDIAKHRADVFRIAATLPGEPGPNIPDSIRADLSAFLAGFPPESADWPAILDSLKTTFGGTKLTPADLIAAIRTYFVIGQ
jgi:hypothetical protein